MPETFQGKVCVVTGAAAGMGRELVRQLLEEGAWVFGLDVNRDALRQLEAEVRPDAAFVGVAADVASEDDMRKAARQIHESAGRVDYLINNAGITMLEETARVRFDQWRRVLDVNFLGVIHGVHFFYPSMIERGAGCIVNVASVGGAGGYATAQAYATSKAAVIGYTRSLRVEADTHGVEIVLVCPGYIDTGIFAAGAASRLEKQQLKATYLVKPVSPEFAARSVMEGLRNGHKVIVFPFSGVLLHVAARWLPFLLAPLQRTLLKRFRAIARTESPEHASGVVQG